MMWNRWAAVWLIAGLGVGQVSWADEVVAPQLPARFAERLAEVYAALKQAYVDEVDDEQLLRDAASGMVAGLDAHSSYLDYAQMQDNGVPNKGPFGGLGIEVAMEGDGVKVVTPIEDTPAFAAGLQSGDVITAIDGQPVKGLSLAQAIQRMRGEAGTHITLTVTSKGRPREVTLVRAVIQNPSVKTRLTERDYPYLRITQFREHTARDLAQALLAAQEENGAPLKGAVLDLRNNPGGSLVAAVAVAAIFLPRDALVVSSEGRDREARARFYANPESYVEGGAANDYLATLPPALRTTPLVVLVNGGSASAAEIVAGALQDHRRASVLGTQSYGKGTIQTLLPMSTGSAVKLTVARYFTPSGRSIEKAGITPDVVVEPAAVGAPVPGGTRGDGQFMQALARLKSARPAP